MSYLEFSDDEYVKKALERIKALHEDVEMPILSDFTLNAIAGELKTMIVVGQEKMKETWEREAEDHE